MIPYGFKQAGSSINSSYKWLLKTLSDNLTSSNLSDLRFVCGFPAGKEEDIPDGLALFNQLEIEGKLCEYRTSILVDVFGDICRRDLVKKVQAFQDHWQKQSGVREHGSPGPFLSAAASTPSVESHLVLVTPNDFLKKANRSAKNVEYVDASKRFPGILLGEGSIVPSKLQRSIALPSDPSYRNSSSIRNIGLAYSAAPMKHYSMEREPRGYCVIISNEDFRRARESETSPLKLHDRPGTKTDRDNLKNVFAWLKFKVEVFDNLTAHSMWRILSDYGRMDHSDYECMVVCILTHGLQERLYGIDGDCVPIPDLLGLFSGVACQTLRGKPKLFFFQACRGEREDCGYQADSDALHSDGWFIRRDPNEKDFFIGYATPPGYTAWLHDEHGSWFISALCDALCKYAHEYDIQHIFLEVNRLVSEVYASDGKKQIPNPTHTLTKLLHFFPESVISNIELDCEE